MSNVKTPRKLSLRDAINFAIVFGSILGATVVFLSVVSIALGYLLG